jgi:nitrogen fixation-related uncharacterized protein
MKHVYSALIGAIIVGLIFWTGMKYQQNKDAEARTAQLLLDSKSVQKVDSNAKKRQTRITMSVSDTKQKSPDWSGVPLPDSLLIVLRDTGIPTLTDSAGRSGNTAP